jgi:hypothetical protein
MTWPQRRVASIGSGRSGQHERRQQRPGMVLSAAQRLQGTVESTVRGGQQIGKVLGLQNGADGRQQVRTGRNASLEWSASPPRLCEGEARLTQPPDVIGAEPGCRESIDS